MSVVKSKRKPTLLKTQVLAVQLLQKTIEICSSKNNFPVRKKWAIPSDLYYEAREYCVCVCIANSIHADDKLSAEKRLAYDRKALEHLQRYMILCNVACHTHPLADSTINSWITLLNESYEFFNKWYKREEEVLKKTIEG